MSEFEWRDAGNASCEKIEKVRADLERQRTKSLFIVRDDTVICEWYAPDHGPDRRHWTASLAKAIIGGTTFMLALADGRVAADDLACKYIPRWRNDPRKSHITLRHLATHTSGLEDAERDGQPHEALPGWMGAFWRRDPDPFTIALDQAPVVFPPGTDYLYSNPGMAALAYALTASLQGAAHTDLYSLLQARIMDPIGVPPEEWQIGYAGPAQLDGLRLYANWGGAEYTARALARVGRLMLKGGDWQGTELVPSRWVETAVADGLCWYNNRQSRWAAVPRDAFAGAGADHQVMLVVPSMDLIVVRMGRALDTPCFWTAIDSQLFTPTLEALG